MKNDRNILIAGGCGFIGSSLVSYILDNDFCDNLYVIDNMSSGSLAKLEKHLNDKRLNVFEGDIIDTDFVLSFQRFSIGKIFNLACKATPILYQSNPIHTLKSSVWGVDNLLQLAMKTGAMLLHSSTSEVYGDPMIEIQNERYWGNVNPIGIRACYDEGKRCAETLLVDYNRMYNVDTRIARIFNTYGTNMSEDDGRVVTNFLTQLYRGEPLTVYGNGEQTRCFCYIDDLLDGIWKLSNVDREMIDGPINFGNPFEITIKELVVIIESLTQLKANVVYLELPKDDPQKRCPDISKAKSILNWEPKISLKDGLRKMIDRYRK